MASIPCFARIFNASFSLRFGWSYAEIYAKKP
jgi:hypothetical protein